MSKFFDCDIEDTDVQESGKLINHERSEDLCIGDGNGRVDENE